MVETIQWVDGAVVMIDQTRLPLEETVRHLPHLPGSGGGHPDMIIRGAPAIGVAAAMGVALGVLHAPGTESRRQMEPSAPRWRPRAPPRSISFGRSTA
jgi:methylthioribose-1-phosphate isomerase